MPPPCGCPRKGVSESSVFETVVRGRERCCSRAVLETVKLYVADDREFAFPMPAPPRATDTQLVYRADKTLRRARAAEGYPYLKRHLSWEDVAQCGLGYGILCYMPVKEELTPEKTHPAEHNSDHLNRLRAAVLGANDGIVSTAAVVVGVAAATTSWQAVATAGLAALVGGAVSMALGEYVSVSSQRDSEESIGVPKERRVNPWSAAVASFLSFLAGAALPFAAAVATPAAVRVAVTLIALGATGAVSARVGRANASRSVVRLAAGAMFGSVSA